MSIAEEFDLRVKNDPKFKCLVDEFCQLIEQSKITGAELFWRKIQELTHCYSEDDIDECQFALLMAGHYDLYAKQGWYLFKSQETLILGQNSIIKFFLGE